VAITLLVLVVQLVTFEKDASGPVDTVWLEIFED